MWSRRRYQGIRSSRFFFFRQNIPSPLRSAGHYRTAGPPDARPVVGAIVQSIALWLGVPDVVDGKRLALADVVDKRPRRLDVHLRQPPRPLVERRLVGGRHQLVVGGSAVIEHLPEKGLHLLHPFDFGLVASFAGLR